jgi:hypothetical protein
MTPRKEYQAAYEAARRARAAIEELRECASPALLKEGDGWRQGDISLVGPTNTWRAWGACKFFDLRADPVKRGIGEAISAWYRAMQLAEIKWGGFRFAEPHATDLPDPGSGPPATPS